MWVVSSSFIGFRKKKNCSSEVADAQTHFSNHTFFLKRTFKGTMSLYKTRCLQTGQRPPLISEPRCPICDVANASKRHSEQRIWPQGVATAFFNSSMQTQHWMVWDDEDGWLVLFSVVAVVSSSDSNTTVSLTAVSSSLRLFLLLFSMLTRWKM